MKPNWLTLPLVKALHSELIVEFGGSAGLRDAGLLESALARPQNLFGYSEPSLPELAASYAFGLCRNHPFIDGNKRIALAAADVFLQLDGHELVAPEAEAVVMTQELASGTCREAEYAEWIKRHCEPLIGDPGEEE